MRWKARRAAARSFGERWRASRANRPRLVFFPVCGRRPQPADDGPTAVSISAIAWSASRKCTAVMPSDSAVWQFTSVSSMNTHSAGSIPPPSRSERELVDLAPGLAHPDERRVHHHLEDLIDLGELRAPQRLPFAHVVRQQRHPHAAVAQRAHAVDHRLVAIEVLEVRLREAVELGAVAEGALDAGEELRLADPAALQLVERVRPARLLGELCHRLAEIGDRDARVLLVGEERAQERRGQHPAEVRDHGTDQAASGSSRTVSS